MDDAPAISVQNVSKSYRIWSTPAQRLLSPGYEVAAEFVPEALSETLRRKAQRGYRDCFVTSLLAMTASDRTDS